MPDELTITELASRIAAHDGLDNSAEAKLHRQIRNFIAQGIIPKTLDEEDGRGTHAMPFKVACVVRLLVPMARLAMDARALRKAAASMLDLPMSESPSRIERAIEATRLGKHVEFVIDGFPDGDNAYFRIEGDPADEAARLILSDYKAATARPQATVSVAASALLKPLLTE
jgi:hypothetical protein